MSNSRTRALPRDARVPDLDLGGGRRSFELVATDEAVIVEIGVRYSQRAIAAAGRRSWFAALAWAVLPPHHLMRLALLVRRDLSVMVEVGAVEMLEREAFRFLKRHATIVIRIRHLE